MKKTMKIVAVLLALLLALGSFAGCAKKTEADTTKDSTEAVDKTEEADKTDTPEIPDGKVYTIGISQLVQHDALDAATKGFQDRLTELLGKDHVEFDLQNASNDIPTCSTIANKFVSDKVDLIMANATPALQAAANATSEIPVVGTSVTEYGTALDIKNFSGKTGYNVTGTSDLAPLDKQAAMFAELLPEAKTIGIIYCSAEANSKYQVNVVRDELEKAGCKVAEYPFADSNDIQAVVTTATQECDALYVPTDNTAANNTELINNICEPAKIPVIAGEEGICKGCGIATLSISYYDLGVATAELAYRILVGGEDPAEMEISYAATQTPKYAADRASALGVTIPDRYTAIEG